jgi:exodeoxyribonuclease VII large subunit
MESPGQTLDLLAPARDVYTVSRLNREARSAIEHALGSVWVEGELSNVARPSSGHLYWTLKDGRAQVRCAMFRQANRRLAFQPEDGQQVLLRGKVSLYEARGEFQLVADYMEEAGEGLLRRRFEALKQQLKTEGLFDQQFKKIPPRLPHRIGVITSPTGAALRDVLHVLGRRFPAVDVIIYPTPVQGAAAAAELAATLELADRRGECDVLLLVRGGGSLEDLWSFNDEALARTLFEVQTPVIAGVGHEIDFTIVDFVADLRAPTPSGAAELAVPDQAEWLRTLKHLADRLNRAVSNALENRGLAFRSLRKRLATVSPAMQLNQASQRLDDLEGRLVRAQRGNLRDYGLRLNQLRRALITQAPRPNIDTLGRRVEQVNLNLIRAMAHCLEQRQARLKLSARALDGLSPLSTLERGYAIVTRPPAHALVSDSAEVVPDDLIDVRLARGALSARVLSCTPEAETDQAKNSATAGRNRSMSTRNES